MLDKIIRITKTVYLKHLITFLIMFQDRPINHCAMFYISAKIASRMNNIYTRDFFITKDYKSLIDQQISLISFDNPVEVKKIMCEILSIDDIFISLYLLQKVEPKCEYVDDPLLVLLENITHVYQATKYSCLDLNELMNRLLFESLTASVSIEVFVKCGSKVKFHEDNIQYFRKYFGYSQIFKYFKSVIETIYVKSIGHREIHFLLILLDNFDLVLGLFNPVFERTTLYVKEDIIDINIVQSVEVIKGVCLFDLAVFKDFPDYLPSLTSFIIKIFYDSENFKFISLVDADLMLVGIEIFLSGALSNPKMKNISTGVFQEAYDNLKELNIRKTTVFEEYISLVCLIDIVYMYFKFSYEQGSRMFDFTEIFNLIKDIKIVFPSAVDKLNRKAVMRRFLERKYKLLDAIAPLIDNPTDISEILNNDLKNKGLCFHILNNLNNILDHINWTDIISCACVNENTEDFIEFIFHEKFINSRDHDHCEFISNYIESLAKHNNQDLLLLAAKLFSTRYSETLLTPKQIHTLFELYLYNIETTIDCRVRRRREIVISFIYYRVDKNSSEMLLTEFLSKVFRIGYLFPNVNILLPLLVLAKKNETIGEESVNDICKYILETVTKQYARTPIMDNEVITYLAVLVEILCFHSKEMYFTDEDYKITPQTYFKLLLGTLCCIFEITCEYYFDKIKEYLLNYLLTAREEERNVLKILLGHIDRKYCRDKPEKSELIEMCKFIKSRVTSL